MPKTRRLLSNIRQSPFPIAQAQQSGLTEPQPGHRNTASWSSTDDEVLVAARAAGLNWKSTAARHFPHKTANACRKRHERLVEHRTHEDWTLKRLDTLAVEYMELRKEIWAPLAVKIGERWNVVEAKVNQLVQAACSRVIADMPVSAWRKVSEIYSQSHVWLARHLLPVRTSLPQTRKSMKVIPASVVRTLSWSQSMFLQLLGRLTQTQRQSMCSSLS